MNKVKRMNLDRKVRYIFNNKKDSDLADMVTNHYGSFIGNTWNMKEALKFDRIVDECDLTVSQFLKKQWKRGKK
jgi:hypothetical protein